MISNSAEIPIYRQIVRQIVEAVYGGALSPGEKLPSHRDLAEELVVAPLTVKRAYDELEAGGYIETQRGRGTFVASRQPVRDVRALRLELQQLTRDLLTRAFSAGLTLTEVNCLLAEAAADMAVGFNNEKIRGKS